MDLQSKAGALVTMGSLAASPVKYLLSKTVRRPVKTPQGPDKILQDLDLSAKTALLEALVVALVPHNVDRLYHNAVRKLTDAENRDMPGDIVDTSAGVSVVLDLEGHMLGPFQTLGVVNLVRTCVLNPHLVAPGTNSDFVDLRIVRNASGPHPFTVYNGVQSLFAVGDAALAVWGRDYVALCLAKIALGYDAWPDDLTATARDYMNNASHLRSRGMVALPPERGAHVWTGVQWRTLPLGEPWVGLYRDACAEPLVLDTCLSFSRSSNGSLTLEYEGEVLSRCNDTDAGRALITEAIETVRSIVQDVRANGGIEGAMPPTAIQERSETPADHQIGLDHSQIARPGLVLSLMRAVEPSIFAPERENSVFAVAEYIQGLERRINHLEDTVKGAPPPRVLEIEGQSAEQMRRRAIRA
jgi:hypothetical protein